MTETRTAFRTCPLCEAGCGLEISVEIAKKGDRTEERVTRIRGDMNDVFSHGYICRRVRRSSNCTTIPIVCADHS